VSTAHCRAAPLPSGPFQNISQKLEIAFSRDTDSLIQIFDAIRDWALLGYHPVKEVNIEKASELGRKWRDVNPRIVGKAAENLKGYE
jgi:hypothetical protein